MEIAAPSPEDARVCRLFTVGDVDVVQVLTVLCTRPHTSVRQLYAVVEDVDARHENTALCKRHHAGVCQSLRPQEVHVGHLVLRTV